MLATKVQKYLFYYASKKKKTENSLESNVNMERQDIIIGLPSIG